jgi:hypothetical protein
MLLVTERVVFKDRGDVGAVPLYSDASEPEVTDPEDVEMSLGPLAENL